MDRWISVNCILYILYLIYTRLESGILYEIRAQWRTSSLEIIKNSIFGPEKDAKKTQVLKNDEIFENFEHVRSTKSSKDLMIIKMTTAVNVKSSDMVIFERKWVSLTAESFLTKNEIISSLLDSSPLISRLFFAIIRHELGFKVFKILKMT